MFSIFRPMYDKPKSSISTLKKKTYIVGYIPHSQTRISYIVCYTSHYNPSILPSYCQYIAITISIPCIYIYEYIYTYNCSKVDRIWKFQTSLCFKNPYILSSPGYFSDIVRFCEVSICNMKYCQYDLLGVPVAIRESVDSA